MSKTKRYNDDDFEDGVLKPGRSMHVPMFALDSVQREIAESTNATLAVDEYGGTSRLNQPGFVRLAPAKGTFDEGVHIARNAMVDEAYRDNIKDMNDAWRGPNISAREIPVTRNTGEAVADAYLDSVDDLSNAWRKRPAA